VFDGFEEATAETGEATIRYRRAGSGPPLLLLHGHPQTSAMWHAVAPALADSFTVIASDLRGYGGSSRPPTTEDHEPYSKRAMARDQVALMASLGFDRFGVAGHDRGGRVAYRLALDHPDAVSRLAVLDIIPTGEHLRRTDRAFALGYWHWFFLAQPFDLPERMIGADPEWFYTRALRGVADPEALAEYLQFATDPAVIHAMCEDYRAGMTYDHELDEANRLAGRRIGAPVLALWAAKGTLGSWYDVLEVWRDWADDVRGRAIDCGHYLPEEAPDEVAGELASFFGGGS
jgi:haloacetate dehalogenase